MHDANVAAARVKHAQKKNEQKKIPSDEEDDLDGQDEERSEDSSSSSESQHAESKTRLKKHTTNQRRWRKNVPPRNICSQK